MEFRLVQTIIAREWRLDHNSRADMRNDILVTKDSYYEVTRERTLPHRLDPGLEAVFRRVWPQRENDAANESSIEVCVLKSVPKSYKKSDCQIEFCEEHNEAQEQ